MGGVIASLFLHINTTMETTQDKSGGEWECSLNLDIIALRLMYDQVCYSIEMWPGAPRRPYQEQEFLMTLKQQLFTCLIDYNFHYGTTEQ